MVNAIRNFFASVVVFVLLLCGFSITQALACGDGVSCDPDPTPPINLGTENNSTATGGSSKSDANATGGNATGGGVNFKGGLNLGLPNPANPQNTVQPGINGTELNVVCPNGLSIRVPYYSTVVKARSTTVWIFNGSQSDSGPGPGLTEEAAKNGDLARSLIRGEGDLTPLCGANTPPTSTIPPQGTVPPVVTPEPPRVFLIPPAPQGVCVPGQPGNGAQLRNGKWSCTG